MGATPSLKAVRRPTASVLSGRAVEPYGSAWSADRKVLTTIVQELAPRELTPKPEPVDDYVPDFSDGAF